MIPLDDRVVKSGVLNIGCGETELMHDGEES